MCRHEQNGDEPALSGLATGRVATAGGHPRSSTALLDAETILRLISIHDVIEAVEGSACDVSAGRTTPAQRAGLLGESTLLMAASSDDEQGVAAKVVSIMPANRDRALATIQGLAFWLEYLTRRPLMVADATVVTALRTGALSAVATRSLSRPDASCLAMVGAGGQAFAQVEGILAVRPIAEIRVASRSAGPAAALRDRIARNFGTVQVSVVADVGTAVAGADVVCLATTSSAPLVELADVPAHVHVNAVGAYRPDMREVGASLFGAAGVVCVDDLEGALREAGDLIDAISDGALDESSVLGLGEVLAGPGRTFSSPDRPTVFKSVGSAAADYALLCLLHERVRSDDDVMRFDFAR